MHFYYSIGVSSLNAHQGGSVVATGHGGGACLPAPRAGARGLPPGPRELCLRLDPWPWVFGTCRVSAPDLARPERSLRVHLRPLEQRRKSEASRVALAGPLAWSMGPTPLPRSRPRTDTLGRLGMWCREEPAGGPGPGSAYREGVSPLCEGRLSQQQRAGGRIPLL